MKKVWNKIALMVAITAMFTFASCERRNAEPRIDAENAQSMEDNNFSENEFDAITDIVQGTSEENFGAKPANGDKDVQQPFLPNCATVTVENWTPVGSNLVGKKIIIAFSPNGCTYQGRTYKGTIITTHTKKYAAPGAIMTTRFENFYVKKASEPDTKYVKLEATKVVVNESAASPNNENIAIAPIKHRIKVFGSLQNADPATTYAKLIFPDNKTIEWNTNRLRTWAEGASTPFVWSDDVFLIAGSHKGKNINNVMYQAQTIEGNPLQFKTVCMLQGIFRPTKGKLQIASTNFPTVVLDFGDGSCDNTFTIQQ